MLDTGRGDNHTRFEYQSSSDVFPFLSFSLLIFHFYFLCPFLFYMVLYAVNSFLHSSDQKTNLQHRSTKYEIVIVIEIPIVISEVIFGVEPNPGSELFHHVRFSNNLNLKVRKTWFFAIFKHR